MDEPRLKRRRTDDSGATRTPVTRSAEYWFDDGNIILQVESTQFRLTKSMLSMHSSVFRDMFMVPLPPDEPTIENCPVVVLSDTAQDWIHLLGAMYPKFFLEVARPPTVELIAGILRLSKKYDIPLFREDCFHRLRMQFPSTLAEYDSISGRTLLKEEPHMLIPLVSLAREFDQISILPLIFYSIVVTESDKYMFKVMNDLDLSFRPADRLACLQGYVRLLDLQSLISMSWIDKDNGYIPARSCPRYQACLMALKDIIYNMSRGQRPEIFILGQWIAEWEVGLCDACRSKARKIFEDARQACWNELPGVFGLPAWEDLKSLDFE
ncbi:hypothetical protein C8F04DRAFT_1070477 [Mycena alexandri]|uniref:BTB domain-containing protein n=1 Tax=Mycena alexandri TaxID=1745969 RepID=A0AAD6TEE8_9AGAR|nr:hypothetical protein C8F04DRAFT_1070477 [Mycena alexandri]